MTELLSSAERKLLLDAAREAIRSRVLDGELLRPAAKDYPPRLQEKGACFITLKRGEQLRGCVGSLQATRPLIQEVCDRAAAAAVNDYRFPPVTAEELPELRIEISRLTPPKPLDYKDPEQLATLLEPYEDGVVLTYNLRKATFLPQVWNQLPDPGEFLDRLCMKMGLSPGFWRTHLMKVERYSVEKFAEDKSPEADRGGD